MVVRWGVIGAGGIAARRTIPEGLLPATGVQLAAVMDVDESRARTVGEKAGVDWYTSMDELLSRSDIDAVYVATPVAHHNQAVLAAARRGKHVLCEKPLALTAAAAEEMVAACAACGVQFGVAHMMRFHGAHRQLLHMLQAGELGQPVLARAQLTGWYPPIPGAWRQDPALGGGGALMDMGTHCIDLLEMLFGPVESVLADVGTITHDYPVDDSSAMLLHFANGARGMVDNNFNVPDKASLNVLEVYGTRGSVICTGTIGQDAGGSMVARLEPTAREYDAQQARQNMATEVAYQAVNTYRAEIEHFSRSVAGEATPELTGALGVRNLRIVAACYEAARRHCRVSIK